MTTVLVVAAHPDDELLGAGGTLARHVRCGHDVHALVVADGATSRYGDGMSDVLAKCAQRAADVLGLAPVDLLSLPDQRLDTLPVLDTSSSTEWAWPLEGNPFSPTLFVDVTSTVDDMLNAMACYESELRDYPHHVRFAHCASEPPTGAAGWGGRPPSPSRCCGR